MATYLILDKYYHISILTATMIKISKAEHANERNL